MQICPQFWRFCKFSDKKFSKSFPPGVLEEVRDVSVRDLFASYFLEAFHKDHQVLNGDDLSGTMVESVVNFLRCHTLFFYNFEVELCNLLTEMDR